jgi:oligoribonuclease NrnB/cAMP/cGMP phosphodiesterase (DHH superfamily)
MCLYKIDEDSVHPGDWFKHPDLPDNVEVVFDMERSGVMLAWDYFVTGHKYVSHHPGMYDDYPHWVKLIGTRDIWKHKNTHWQEEAEALHACLTSHSYNFDIWERTLGDLGLALDEGNAILRYFNQQITAAEEWARIATFQGNAIAIVNAPYFMASELGNRLAKKYQFAVIYSVLNDGVVLASLRSVGDFDVSAVAKLFGGGGHKNAAGCKFASFEVFKSNFW